MIDNPRIIVINDRIEPFHYLQEAAKNSFFGVDPTMFKPIVPAVERSFLMMKGMREDEVICLQDARAYLESDRVPEEVVILLDLNLELDPRIRTQLRNDFDIPLDIFEHFIDGTALALSAIENERIKKMIIYISSTWGSLGDLFEFLEERISRSGLPGRSLFDEGNLEVPYSVPKAMTILDSLEQAWRNRTEKWGSSLEELGKGLLSLHFGGDPVLPAHLSDGFFLKKALLKDLESFAALFLLPGSEAGRISIPLFAEILKRLGIVVIDNSEMGRMNLPIHPGMLLVMNLASFLDHLGQNQVILFNSEGRICLKFEVREAKRLESALVFSGGGLVEAYRNLLICSSSVLQPYVTRPGSWEVVSSQWPPRPFPDHGGYPLLLDWILEGDECVLSWANQL